MLTLVVRYTVARAFERGGIAYSLSAFYLGRTEAVENLLFLGHWQVVRILYLYFISRAFHVFA